MLDIFYTVFKFKEKESPDKLGLYPERAHTQAMPERRYLWSSRILVILAVISMSITMMLALTIYLMLPQKTVYPRLLQINKYFSQLELVQPAERRILVTDLIAEQHISEYITLRNSIRLIMISCSPAGAKGRRFIGIRRPTYTAAFTIPT